MGFFDEVMKFIVKKFWPWFKEFVWPYIKEHVKELIVFAIGELKKIIKKWLSNKSETREREANQKAQEAESQANDSSITAEAEKYRAIAKIWREVAEQFRSDNEEMKRRLDEFEAEAKMRSEAEVNDLNLDVDFSKEKPILMIGPEVKKLPALFE